MHCRCAAPHAIPVPGVPLPQVHDQLVGVYRMEVLRRFVLQTVLPYTLLQAKRVLTLAGRRLLGSLPRGEVQEQQQDGSCSEEGEEGAAGPSGGQAGDAQAAALLEQARREATLPEFDAFDTFTAVRNSSMRSGLSC
jgi:hypothetical protein